MHLRLQRLDPRLHVRLGLRLRLLPRLRASRCATTMDRALIVRLAEWNRQGLIVRLEEWNRRCRGTTLLQWLRKSTGHRRQRQPWLLCALRRRTVGLRLRSMRAAAECEA